MLFIRKYIYEISFILGGFYLAAIVFSYGLPENRNFIDTLNSLGNFIAAGGAIAAILTIIQQVQFRREDHIKSEAEYVQYCLVVIRYQTKMLDTLNKKRPRMCVTDDSGTNIYYSSNLTINANYTQINFERMVFLANKDIELFNSIIHNQSNYVALSRNVKTWNDRKAIDRTLADFNKINTQNKILVNELMSDQEGLNKVLSEDYSNFEVINNNVDVSAFD